MQQLQAKVTGPWGVILAGLLLLPAGLRAQGKPVPKTAPEELGLFPKPPECEPRRFRRDWLAPATAFNKHRTPVQRAQTAIDCIVYEVRYPSEGKFNRLANNHHKTLEWMLLYVGAEENARALDPGTLRRAVATLPAGEARDVVLILCGLGGAAEMRGPLSAYLTDLSRPGLLRGHAAEALGRLQSPQSIDLLFQVALTDPAWEERTTPHPRTGATIPIASYPVRWHALQALRAYERDNLLPERVKARLDEIRTSGPRPAEE